MYPFLSAIRFNQVSRLRIWMLFGAAFLSALFASWNISLSLSVVFFLLLLSVLVYKVEYGLWFLVIFTPFRGWDVTLPYTSLNAPLVDFVAMFVAIAFMIRWMFTQQRISELFHRIWPEAVFFLIFLLGIMPSFFIAPEPLMSLKYLFRPILFFFLFFVILPMLLLDTPQKLHRTLMAHLGVGMSIAIFGMLSLFFAPHVSGWLRVQPWSVLGFAPLGSNHNLLAEALIVVIPFSWLYVLHVNNLRQKKLLIMVTLMMMLASLATLSRAGMGALLLEGLIFLVWYFRSRAKQFFSSLWWLAIVVLPFTVLMYIFSQTNVVQSSNVARSAMTQIALEHWRQHPWIGNGLGTFVGFLEQNPVFRLQFGDPVDAHGVIQKLLVEGGIIGLSGFVMFVVLSIFWIIRQWIKATRVSKSLSSSIPLLVLPDEELIQPSLSASHEWLVDSIMMSLIACIGILSFGILNTAYFAGITWLPLGLAFSSARLSMKIRR